MAELILDGFGCCALSEINGLQDHRSASDILEELFHYNGDHRNSVNTQLTLEEEKYDPKRDAYDFVQQLNDDFEPPAFIIFSEAFSKKPKGTTIGLRLHDTILSQGLGSVTASDWNKNPNSGNYVRVFVWATDRKGLIAWAKRELVGKLID